MTVLTLVDLPLVSETQNRKKIVKYLPSTTCRVIYEGNLKYLSVLYNYICASGMCPDPALLTYNILCASDKHVPCEMRTDSSESTKDVFFK